MSRAAPPDATHEPGAVSPWFSEQRERLAAASQLGPIVDLACGRGRHLRACAEAGWPSLGIDRNPDFLSEARAAIQAPSAAVAGCVRSDIEAAPFLPVKAGSCGAILVFRFLFRPLAPRLIEALAPGGLLVYETFTWRQPELGWGPRRPEFLLAEAELPELFAGLEILAHDEGLREDVARPEYSARLLARRP